MKLKLLLLTIIINFTVITSHVLKKRNITISVDSHTKLLAIHVGKTHTNKFFGKVHLKDIILQIRKTLTKSYALDLYIEPKNDKAIKVKDISICTSDVKGVLLSIIWFLESEGFNYKVYFGKMIFSRQGEDKGFTFNDIVGVCPLEAKFDSVTSTMTCLESAVSCLSKGCKNDLIYYTALCRFQKVGENRMIIEG
jgi:hypothetical protein